MRVKFEIPDIDSLKQKYMMVDMHFHSRYSHDSNTKIEEIIKRAKKLGVTVALTDHNSISGVLAAEQIEKGVVHPGIEVTTKEGKDVLLYFPTVKELEDFFNIHIKPYVKKKLSIRGGKTGVRIEHLLSAAAETRALVVIPHPFVVGARRSYLFFKRRIHLLDMVHGIEVANQALPHKANLLASGWALECSKSMISGSDGHILKMLGTAFTCAKVNSWEDFIDACKRDKTVVVGQKSKFHHHIANLARILKEKGRVINNRKISNGES